MFLESDIEVEKCNLFAGKWIPDSSGPIYTNNSCGNLIDGHQNCITNGRPDLDFLYWKWKPHDCLLPRFDPRRFLQLMRNKSWAFIGDSIVRNHVESLLCMLYSVITLVFNGSFVSIFFLMTRKLWTVTLMSMLN